MATSSNDPHGSVAPSSKRRKTPYPWVRSVSTLDEDSGNSGGEDLDTQVSMPAFHQQARKRQMTSSASRAAPSEAAFGGNEPEVSNQIVVAKSDDDVVCWFGCGIKGMQKLNNIGGAQYPRYACPPCLSASRAWVKQGESDPSVKKQCKDIMSNHQEKYKKTICAMRLKPDGDWDSYLLPLN
jgi:hypothetical protein